MNFRSFKRFFSRGSKTVRRSQRSPQRSRRSAMPLQIEMLESRDLPSVLPAPTVTGRTELDFYGGSSAVYGSQIAADPLNPNLLVDVHGAYFHGNSSSGPRDYGEMWGDYSFDGGVTWSGFQFLNSTQLDPNEGTDPAGFSHTYNYITNVSVAFDRTPADPTTGARTFYVVMTQHNAASTSGALVLNKFTVDQLFGFQMDTTIGNLPSSPGDYLLYRWYNTDAAFNTYVGIDTNETMYTDPVTGQVQTDSLATMLNDTTYGLVPKAVWVTWNTNHRTGVGATTSSNIMVSASADGGHNFTTHQFLTSFGINATANEPRIIFSQGTPYDPLDPGSAPRVPGGMMTVAFNNGATAGFDTFQPDGGDPAAYVASAQEFVEDSPSNDQTGGSTVFDAFAVNGGDIPSTTTFTIPVNLNADGFTSLNDLDVELDLQTPNRGHLLIELTAPNGQTFTLVFNRIDNQGNDSGFGVPNGPDYGVITDIQPAPFTAKHDGGLFFDLDSWRAIDDPTANAPYVGHYGPQGFGWSSLYNLPVTDLNGDWVLSITDVRNNGNNPPPQFLRRWGLHFTSNIDRNFFGSDTPAVSTVATSVSNVYPTNDNSAAFTGVGGSVGIGPGAVVAYDNTLGSFSPFQGRLYMAYTAPGVNIGDRADVRIAFSDDNGGTWSSSYLVNDDQSDNFSEGNRVQYMPALAVDPVTGAVVVSYYDGRMDAAHARLANSLAVSVDGGHTFSPSVFLNDIKTAGDFLTGQTVTIEPIPGNQNVNGVQGFGDRQGLVAFGGRATADFGTNYDAATSRIRSVNVAYAAGPRIVQGDMGPVNNDSHNPDNPNVFTYNTSFTNDGTRKLDGFVVTFDRPIDPNSFDAGDISINYQNAQGVNTNISSQVTSITPLDLDQQHGNIDKITQPTATFGDDALVIEGNIGTTTQAVFKVYVSQPQAVDVVMAYETQDDTAIAGRDYVAKKGTVTIPAGQLMGTFTVDVLGDNQLEGPEDFLVNMTSVTPNMRRWFTFAVGRIIDDEGPRSVTIGDAVLPEGSTGPNTMTFYLKLSTPDPVNAITVDYATFDFTAFAGSDYTAKTGTVTFAPGETLAQIDITLRGDTVVEDNEIFGVQLLSLTGNAVFARTIAGGYVQEDDDFGTRPTVAIGDALVREGDSGLAQATFTVALSFVQPNDVVLSYTTMNGSATAGQDYIGQVNTVIIPQGQTTATFSIPVKGDTAKEGNETFKVQLASVSAGLIVVRDVGIGTIVDDDGAPSITVGDAMVKEGDNGTKIMQFPVTLSVPSSDPVSVDYATAQGTARADVDYVGTVGTFDFAPNQTTGFIDIVINGDQTIEVGNEKFTLRLFNAKNASVATPVVTGTIVDDDELGLTVGDVFVQEGDDADPAAPPVFANVVVYMNAATSQDVTFTYLTTAGSATAGQDYTSVAGSQTIQAGQTSFVIQVPILYDVASEPLETFQFQITSSTNAALIRDTATISIVDNDQLPDVTVGDLVVREGDNGTTVANVPLYLSFPVNSPVSVTYTLTNGPALPPDIAAATSGPDYVGSGGVVVIPAGTSVTSINIPIVGDTTPERVERLTIQITGVTGNAELSNKTDAVLTIIDNDVGVSISDVTEFETDNTTSFTFTLTLSSPSGQTISVQAATAAGSATAGVDYDSNTQTITFTPGQISQSFQVDVNGDTGAETNEDFFVNLTNVTGNATILRPQGHGIIVDDDDTGSPFWTIGDATMFEGNSGTPQMGFTIFLSHAVGAAQTIRYSTTSNLATATPGQDYTPVLNQTATMAANTTSVPILIDILPEQLQEGNEFFFVVLSNPTAGTIRRQTATGTILEDDQQVLVFGDESLVEGNQGNTFAQVPIMLSNPGPNNQPYDFATADGTAINPDDYFGRNGTRVIFTPFNQRTEFIPVVGDLNREGNENFTLSLVTALGNIFVPKATSNVTIVDDDDLAVYISDFAVVEGTGGVQNAVFTVYLNSPSDQPVDVTYTTLDGTADDTDYTPDLNGSVTIPANALFATITIPLNTDSLDEGNETFSVLLTGVTGAGMGKDTGTCLIVDDDRTPALTVSPGFLREQNGPMNFTVYSSFPITPAIDMTVGTTNLLATAGADFDALTNFTRTLPSGATSISFPVNIHEDALAEGNEDFRVTLSGATQGATFAAASDRGVIADNEQTVTLNIGDIIVKENDNGSKTYTIPVLLSNPVNQPISVFYQTVDDTAKAPSDYVAITGAPSATNPLVIPANATSAVISVTINGDGFREGNQQFFVNLFNASGASLAKQQATVIIVDDDSAFGATQFLVHLTPQSGIGTYSYAIGPDISDRVQWLDYLTAASTNTYPAVPVIKNLMDQNNDSHTGQNAGAVTGATNAGPIVITTSENHALVTGATVQITGVAGNSAANGIWTITVIDAKHFSLDTSVGNGAYAGGGVWTSVVVPVGGLTPSVVALPPITDRFSVPGATLQVPFAGPYDADTLPLIIPGPHYIASGFNTATFNATPNALVPSVGQGGTNNVFNDSTVTTLTVAGLSGQLADLNVHVHLDYPNSSDLVLRLRAPNGQLIPLAVQRGTGNAFLDTTFDDQAATSVTGATAPFGTVRPESPLSALNYLDASQLNGQWKLEVEDRGATGVGKVFDWSLTMTTTNTADYDASHFSKQGNESLPDSSDPIGNPAGTVFSKLNVSGLTGWITDVDLRVNIDYANSGDLDIFLRAPNGVVVEVARFHGDGNFYQDTLFDDQAPNNIVLQDPYGPFFHVHPFAILSLLNGIKSELLNGQWTLEIDGASSVAGGILKGWSLDIKTSQFTDNVVVNNTNDHQDVVFDRDINPSSFTAADVLRMVGPAGVITGPFTVTPLFNYTTNKPLAGVPESMAKRAFRIGFPAQSISGTYSIVFGPNIETPTELQLITIPSTVTAVTFSYNGTAATSALAFSSFTTALQVQAHLQSIPALAGKITVTGANGGPYTVAFTGFSNQQVSVIAVKSFVGGTVSPTVAEITPTLDNNLNVDIDKLYGGSQVTGTLTGKTYPWANPNPPGTAFTIPANGSVTATLQITDGFNIVQNPANHIQLALDITHSTDPDLDAYLVAPDGTQIRLFSRVSVFAGITFDDFAVTPVQPGGTTFGLGTFNPQLPLSRLQGKFTSGTWQLVITNNGSTPGTLNSWSLHLPYYQSNSGLGEPVADQFSTNFRIFTMDPTLSLSSSTWTAVGPAASNQHGSSGRVTAIAVDPSDPSGNTVYIGAANGGVWKTTDFLTASDLGPTYVPLTDLGPSNSLNINTITVIPRNNNPLQSIILVGTGETDSNSPGIGILRSMDGGATWQVIDSRNQNFDASGNPLPLSSGLRDHGFVGARVNKIAVDPTLANGEYIVYIAVGGTNAGIYRSMDTGKTWTLLQGGNGTDVVLAAASGSSGGTLQVLYAAVQGVGVFYTTSAPATSALIQMTGGLGKPNHRDLVDRALQVTAPLSTPNGNRGRIMLATPAKTNDRLADTFYQNWLYALVLDDSAVNGYELYVTKDRGDNWTRVVLAGSNNYPLVGTAIGGGLPTNDENITGTGAAGDTATILGLNPGTVAPGSPNTLVGGNDYEGSLTIDPTNPNIIYLGGTLTIKVDITTIADAWATVISDHSDNVAGAGTGATAGPIVPFASMFDGGIPATPNAPDPRDDHYNMYRDPYNPFLTPSTFYYQAPLPPAAVARWANDGKDVRWSYFDAINDVFDQSSNDPFRMHEVVALRDPLTGKTRVIVGNDQGVFTAVDALSGKIDPATNLMTRGNSRVETGIGFADSVRGSRNGNLQIAQMVSGAVQPSTLAADVAGSLFYGMSLSNGVPASSSDIINTGNLNWQTYDETRFQDMISASVDTNGTWVMTDATGGFDRIDPNTGAVIFDPNRIGTTYQYRWPCCINQVNLFIHDFWLLDLPNNLPPISRTTGLLQSAWPNASPGLFNGQTPRPFGRFAVNPLDPSAAVISSQAGRVYRTAGPLDGYGILWSPIGEPAVFGNSTAQAMAFGSPDSTALNLNDFIYAGTNAGEVYVTFNGGGLWTNISTGLDGSAVLSVVPSPRRGSREVFAITGNGVYYMRDSAATAPTWTKLNDTAGRDSLFNFTRPVFNNPNDLQAIMLQGQITSLAIDWRYQIPNNAGDSTNNLPGADVHPVIYVAGNAGVFRSIDNGISWQLYPSNATNAGAPQEGGFLPNVRVTDLDLMLGYLNPATGTTNHAASQNVLMASTFGRGAFAIRLDDTGFSQYLVDFISGPKVTTVQKVSPNPGATLNGFDVTFDSLVDKITFTPADVVLLAPNGQAIPIVSVTEQSNAPVGGLNPHNLFRITFAAQSAKGNYKLTIGENLTDFGGNKMNQDGDTTNGENPADKYSASIYFEPNTAPTISNIPDQNATPGTPLIVPFTIADAQTPTQLTLQATVSNPALFTSLTFNGNPNPSIAVSLTPTINISTGLTAGVVTVTVTVTDPNGLFASDSFQVAINNPPTLTSNPDPIPDVTDVHTNFPKNGYATLIGGNADPGETLTYVAEASKSPTFAAGQQLPAAFAQINATTGVLDLNPTGYLGTYYVRAGVTDGQATVYRTFKVTVTNTAPTLAALPDISDHHRAFPKTNIPLQGNDVDPGETLTYTAKAYDTAAYQAYQLDQSLGLFSFKSNYDYNKRLKKEKYLKGNGNILYYLMPNGQFFRFTGTATTLKGTLIATLSAAIYQNPSLLWNAQLTELSGNYASVTPGTNLMQITPPVSFLGSFTVEATVSDSIAVAKRSFKVTVFNNAPKWNTTIGSVTAHHTQYPQTRTLDGADPDALDAPFLTYSAQAFERYSYRARQLDLQLGLSGNGPYATNQRKKHEKYIKGAGNKVYYILPNGQFFRFTGTSTTLSGVLLETFPTAYYADPSKLWNSANPTVLAGFVNVSGNQINFTPSNFTGVYFVEAKVSDGAASATQTIQVNVVNNPPTLAPINDRTISHTVASFQETLVGSDPDAADAGNLTYSALAYDGKVYDAYSLDQANGFNSPTGADRPQNFRGFNEKYFSGAGGKKYVILPNGNLYRFVGLDVPTTPLTATGTKPTIVLLGTFDASYWQTPSKLWNAAAPTPLAPSPVSVSGNVLTFTTPANFAGRIYVQASVSDGGFTSSRLFKVFITNNPPVLDPINNLTVTSSPSDQTLPPIPLTFHDDDGAFDTLTFTPAPKVETLSVEAFNLDQQLGLFDPGHNFYFNYYGFGEKWLRSAVNNNWYAILPNGELHELGNLNAGSGIGPVIANFDSSYYDNPALLYNAQDPGTLPTVTAQIIGTNLFLTIGGGFTGTFRVTVFLTDGIDTVQQSFFVTVQ